ncbi:MAG: cell wall hydrolase [Clostridia bacterium]|jgi:N-acetylmuramoyl-L-alanine amidase|nr:cell wall hydrolase [Clostridia bacterium]
MKNTQRRFVGFIVVMLILTLSCSSVFAAGTTYPLLKYGSRGTAVVKLQQALKTQGFLSGSADGIYGSMTRSAVVKFQTAKKISVDGIAGNQTQTRLYAQTTATTLSRGTSVTTTTAATNLYWLSRIIHAEAEAEPYAGKVAVGNVIINRVNSGTFASTIKGVIFEYSNGLPQFSPVADGTIYNTPSAASIQAAKDAMAGQRPVGAAMFFFNPDKASGSWIVNNKTFVKTIGDHDFYK